MEQKFDEFSMKEAMKLANSDTGKALFAVIRDNHSAEMEKIRRDVESGNMEAAKAAILKLMQASDTRAFIPQSGESHG